jgi:hypothetical protein
VDLLDGIPKNASRRLPRSPLVRMTHLFKHCLRVSHFPKPWKEAVFITLRKSDEDPKFPQNFRLICLLSTTDKVFEKVIPKFVQRHIEERGLLNVNEFSSRAHHNTTFQCIRPTGEVTVNFSNNMSTAAIYIFTCFSDYRRDLNW